MANSSILNSKPATGRSSTTSSRRSRKRNSVAALLAEVFGLVKADQPRALRVFNAQCPTLNAQHSIQTVGRWKFFPSGRVKGAWWPSRSSKPSPPRKWRGRFDSYPLRQIIFDFRLPIVDCQGTARVILSIANRNSKIGNRLKGSEPQCRVNRSVN
jgi:hypothetical protein